MSSASRCRCDSFAVPEQPSLVAPYRAILSYHCLDMPVSRRVHMFKIFGPARSRSTLKQPPLWTSPDADLTLMHSGSESDRACERSRVKSSSKSDRKPLKIRSGSGLTLHGGCSWEDTWLANVGRICICSLFIRMSGLELSFSGVPKC